LSTARSDRSEAALLVDGIAVPVRVLRSARARRYRLTLDARTGGVRLSLPARANLARALGWAQEQAAWIGAQMAATPPSLHLCDGAVFPLEGQDVRILWAPDGKRRVEPDGDVLWVGGPQDAVGQRVLRWLKARAKQILTAETEMLASSEALPLTSVAIGDPRSRWGSCASSGAIRYSWRLILAPPHVRRSTVAHEVAHLIHMDHSPAFHAAHARLLGADPRPARAWLKAHGAGLHSIGC